MDENEVIPWGELEKESQYRSGQVATCPHCNVRTRFETAAVHIHHTPETLSLTELYNGESLLPLVSPVENYMVIGTNKALNRFYNFENVLRKGLVILESAACPSCDGLILVLSELAVNIGLDGFAPIMDDGNPSDSFWWVENTPELILKKDEFLIWPRQLPQSYPILPEQIPADLTRDYQEAYAILDISPKASAALARRCLEELLDKQGIKGEPRDTLAGKISSAIKQLPSDVGQALELIRHYGNFAAHTQKNVSSGEIVDVEPEEADISLKILSWLLNYYYVRSWNPEQLERARIYLESKLLKSGKLRKTID